MSVCEGWYYVCVKWLVYAERFGVMPYLYLIPPYSSSLSLSLVRIKMFSKIYLYKFIEDIIATKTDC